MKRVRKSISEGEYTKLITHTLSDPTLKDHSRVKLLRVFHVLYFTGIRVNEISHITIGKLKEIIKAGEGIIYTSKKDKERVIYLSEQGAKKLSQLTKDEEDHNYLVCSWNKATTPMHPISLIKLVNDYMKKVLGAGYTSHSFRQGIVTDMFSSGAATKVVQMFIGHADAATTLRYDTPTPARIKSALVR